MGGAQSMQQQAGNKRKLNPCQHTQDEKEDIEDILKQIISTVPVCLYGCEERLKYFLHFWMSEQLPGAKKVCFDNGVRCDFEPMDCKNMFDYIEDVKLEAASHASDSIVFRSNMKQKMGKNSQVWCKMSVRDDRKKSDDDSLWTETMLYKYANTMILRSYTSHVVAFVSRFSCSHKDFPEAMQANVKSLINTIRPNDEVKYKGNTATVIFADAGKYQLKNVDEEVNAKDIEKIMKPDYMIDFAVTEGQENTICFEDWINKHKTNASFNQDFKDILFQILWTLGVFKELGFEHHDLHWGNILITDLQTTSQTEYQLNKTTFFRLETRWWVRIFDFDHASLYSKVDELVISNPLMCNHTELLFDGDIPSKAKAGEKQYPEFDLVSLLISMQMEDYLTTEFVPQNIIDEMNRFEYKGSKYAIPKWKDYPDLTKIITNDSLVSWMKHLKKPSNLVENELNLWKMPSVEVDARSSIMEDILWWSGSGVHENQLHIIERGHSEWKNEIQKILFKHRWDKLCTKFVNGENSGPDREHFLKNSILEAQDVAFYITESEIVKGFLFGKIIGLGVYRKQSKEEQELPKTFYIELVCASGFANELFEEAENYAREKGCKQMALRAATVNKNVKQSLIESYKRRGFGFNDDACKKIPNETRSPSPMNKDVDADGFWMTKCLKP